MRKPASVRTLENLGRVRPSDSFFMRDFLYSEISQIEGIPKIPDYPDKAIEMGTPLCHKVLAWWVHDHVDGYCSMYFFPRLAAFNITWSTTPERRIDSCVPPVGTLTKPRMDNHDGDHSAEYREFLLTLSVQGGMA